MSAVQLAPEHQVTHALLQLAGHRTPDRIAAHLHELGVRGDHGCGTCPIANYVLQQTGLAVLITRTTWQFIGVRWRGDSTPWTLPGPLGVFIAAHDRDHYPHLYLEQVST